MMGAKSNEKTNLLRSFFHFEPFHARLASKKWGYDLIKIDLKNCKISCCFQIRIKKCQKNSPKML